MKVKVDNRYRLEMGKEQAECLLALIFCNLYCIEDSPLDGLSTRLKNALHLDDDQVTALAKRYGRFV